MLIVVWCSFSVARCSLRVACCLLVVNCSLLLVGYWLLLAVSNVLFWFGLWVVHGLCTLFGVCCWQCLLFVVSCVLFVVC